MRKPFQIKIVFIILFVFFGIDSKLAAAGNDLNIQIDYASFQYNESSVYLELYYELSHAKPQFVKTGNNLFRWTGLVDVKIYHADSLIINKTWKAEKTVKDTSGQMNNVDILDAVPFILLPGDYNIIMTVKDHVNPQFSDSCRLSITIDPIPANKAAISDIQLCLDIQPAGKKDRKNPFYKNTMLITPNPSRIYGENRSILYFYTETYNLYLLDKTYLFNYWIEDTNGNRIFKLPPKSIRRKNKFDSIVEKGAIPMDSLQSGTYLLHLFIADTTGRKLAGKEKKFFVYNSAEKQPKNRYSISGKDYLTSPFAQMNGQEVEQEINYIVYIADVEALNSFQSIDNLNGKRKWLYQFWQQFDIDKSTRVNEFRQEYLQRILYSDKNFRAFNREGWKTDRGRVYILYGKPNYVMQYPNEKAYRPYIIWNYDRIQGGVVFVFVDFNLNRDYRLVHSTMQGEIQNYDWRSLAKKGVY